MKQCKRNRILSVLLALVMVFSMVPTTAYAADPTYKKVEVATAADITAGTYLLYGISSSATDDGTSGGFMTTQNSTATRLKSSDLTIDSGSVTTEDDYSVWNLIATEGGFLIQNKGNSKYLYYGSNSGNNIYQTDDQTTAGVWTVVSNGDNWTLQENASGRQLSCNRFGNAGSYYLGFAAYASTSSVKRVLEFYKLEESTIPSNKVSTPTASPKVGEVVSGTQITFACATDGAVIKYHTGDEKWQEYTGGVTVTQTTTFHVKAVKDGMTESDVATFAYTINELSTIQTALAGATGTVFKVQGVVTLVDGKNIYIQDATGGICAYMLTAPTDIQLGDTIIVTGSRKDYNGLPELDGASYSKSGGLTLAAKETTIAALTSADICTYVQLKDLTVTAVEEVSGKLTVTVEDSAGKSIQIFKGVVGKTNGTDWDLKVDDTITVNAAVGVYKETLQLRNTKADEIVVTQKTDYVPISDALAGEAGTSFTVKGVVTLMDGKNIYIQDATGGICAYMSTAPTDIQLGDTIIATGAKKVYNGLPELDKATYKKSSGLTLAAKETTIDKLSDADICTYVKLTGLEITEVYDNNGKYTNPNITVKDSDGKTIQLYKAVIGKDSTNAWEYKVGDKIDITAAVGVNKNTRQLRNTLASEITLTPKVQYAKLNNTIADGDQFVIYYNKDSLVMTNTSNGNASKPQLTGEEAKPQGEFVRVTDTMAVLTAGVDKDGNYTFTNAAGKYLTSGATGNSLTFEDTASDYSLWTIKSVTNGVHVVNVNAVYSGKAQALEVYNGEFTMFSEKDTDYYLFNLYKLTDEEPAPVDDILKDGSQVVIYNLSSQGVLALQDDNETSPSITNAAATVADDEATAENGGLIFTVEKNGDYYRFSNETYGYLCSNGTGNNAFYSKDATDDADWKLTDGKKGGFNMESRTAKYNGTYSQYLEYYAGAYKTYSMYNVTDYDIYEFMFYPCANATGDITGGVVNKPAVDFGTTVDAYVGMEYKLSFTVDAVFGVAELKVTVNSEEISSELKDGTYTVTIPVEKVTGTKLAVAVTGKDTKNVAISGAVDITVKNEPVIVNVTPAAGSQTGADKRPVISAEITNAGENPDTVMTVNEKAVAAEYKNGKLSYTPAADMEDGTVTVKVTVTRADGKSAEKTWSFTVGEAQYQLYFGQLHSHTTYSDGSGTLDAALEYVKNLPDSANVDFVAFTDHSNYFDKSGTANPEGALYDMSLASEDSQSLWSEYKNKVADFNAAQTDIVAIGGFEMTWSGGPGHINTFNSPGIVSRNNTTLNNKIGDAGLKAYYALLSQEEGANTLSQLNHPGSTFGTFADFSYWDAVIDSRVMLVEVGNGEGQIGAGGYYPSYEYYTMALDKGWHVAPTNNQDNHKGKWGNANDARDVILTDDFSEQGLYEAIRQLRVYATEDKNLAITYTVNDQQLGSSIKDVPDKLEIKVTVNDPDASDSISKVEVIVNSGKTIYTWNDPAELASGVLSCELAPDYSYYYIRVTEGDGDLAVTAPVWVGESLKLGISSLECGTSTPVTGEELTLTTTLFNSESQDATIESITYTTNGSVVLGTDTAGYTIPAAGTLSVDFKYTPTVAKVSTVTATVVMKLDGKEYTFTKDIELDVLNADNLVYVGIDASHYNEYVAGNYKDSMGNFGTLAAEYSVRTVELKTSEDLIAACSNAKYKALILTAPSRRDGTALRNPYETYSDTEIEALTAFNKAGGTVVLCGWGDFYESYSSFPAEDHMAAQQNKVLEALGSSLRIADDETKDDTYNGGQSQRLYLSSYNFDSFLLKGVEYDKDNPHNNMYTELYSQYGGASVYVVDADGKPTGTIPGTVTPVVYGFDTTYSSDDDKDNYGGLGSTQKYLFDGADRLMVMAAEQLDGQGLIVVAGAAFLSNFEVQATISDNGSEKNYSNYKICENLLQRINPVQITDIADVAKQTEAGFKYTIEGVVISNASGYDKNTAFFDCIYVQDETGGICCFPVAGNFRIGDKVHVTGTTDFYQGEPELQVTSIEKIDENQPVVPKSVSAKEINDGSVMGSLVTLKGTVVSFELANGLVQTIMVKDKNGDVARVFIDGYIIRDDAATTFAFRSATPVDVENLAVGCEITVTGCASYDDTFNAPEGPFPRIRVRNRADVVCTGHKWGNWYLAEAASCTADGRQEHKCDSCGVVESKPVSATNHSWSDWKVTKAPTATENGIKTRTCTKCGHTENQSVAKLGSSANAPSTGDTAKPILWMVVGVAALVGLCGIVVARRKKEQQ